MECPSCNKKIQANRRECAFCGANLGKEPPPVDPDFAAIHATQNSAIFKFLSRGVFVFVTLLFIAIFAYQFYMKIGTVEDDFAKPPPPGVSSRNSQPAQR